jgi:hypothetical protein
MTSPLQIPQPRCPQPGFENLELARFIHVEEQPNGGALVAHAYCSELSALSPAEMQQFAQEFVTLAFSEDTSSQAAHYVMGIIHGAASYLPDFLDYFSWKFPSSPVKMEILGKKDIETTTMLNFHNQVRRLFGWFVLVLAVFVTVCDAKCDYIVIEPYHPVSHCWLATEDKQDRSWSVC